MYCSTCYYTSLSISNLTRLLKISQVAAKIIGLPTPMLLAILKKARAVAAESGQLLLTYFHILPSLRRCHCIKCKTARYSRSFVPVRMIISDIYANGFAFCVVTFCISSVFCDNLAIMICTMYILFKDIKVN